MKSTCIVLMATVFIASVAPPSEAANCGVISNLYPCLPYVRGTAKSPQGGCCNGIKRLYAAAKTRTYRRDVCNCLKAVAGSHSGINIGKAVGLPRQCGVHIPYKISPSIDCSKVQ